MKRAFAGSDISDRGTLFVYEVVESSSWNVKAGGELLPCELDSVSSRMGCEVERNKAFKK